MSYSYLVLPHLHIQNANAQPTTWLVGPPPVTSYAGFAHALALAIGANGHAGVGLVHHDIQFLGEVEHRTLHPHQFRAASFIDKDDYASSSKHALSLQPTVRCHLTVSVVIRFDVDALVPLHQVAAFLRGARLAGGSLIDHQFSECRENCFLEDEHDPERVAASIGSGFAVHERSDLLAMQSGDQDRLDTFLRVTRDYAYGTGQDSWILPTALGYAQITEARQRRNVRADLPHAFAEPLVGFVQYRPLRESGLPFWRYACPEPGVFVVTTQAH